MDYHSKPCLGHEMRGRFIFHTYRLVRRFSNDLKMFSDQTYFDVNSIFLNIAQITQYQLNE